MEEQKIILEKINTFELENIFECGQCFRWNRQENGSYTGVFGKNIVNVKKQGENLIIEGICKKDIKETVKEYFDLDRDYSKIKKTLEKVDQNMQESIQKGQGIRLLNQDLWETIISFILSANNNMPRIKKMIERLEKRYV